MTTMRALLGLSFLLLAACSSSDDSSSGPSGPFEPAGNGQPIGEAEACAQVRAAEDARGAELSCGPVTRPACPGYISSGNPACSQYDQGTVQGCVDYISTIKSCATLKTKSCLVKVLPGTAPNGCPPPVDAGVDSGTDAAVSDAAGD